MHQRKAYPGVIVVVPCELLDLGEAVECLAVFAQLATGSGQQDVDSALRRDVILRAVHLLSLRQLPGRSRPVPNLHQRRAGYKVRARHQLFGGACTGDALRAQRKHDRVVWFGVDQLLGPFDQCIRIDLIGRPARSTVVCGTIFARVVQGTERLARTIHRSSTQVSLVPPPCDELTTSDPSRRATRHSPPRTVTTSFPDST